MNKNFILDTLKRDLKVCFLPSVKAAVERGLASRVPTDYFIQDNYFTYYTLITVWLEMVSAFSTEAKEYLYANIQHSGLVSVVSTCSKMCDEHIIPFLDQGKALNTCSCWNEFCMMLYWDILQYQKGHGLLTDDATVGGIMLEILRFPKRFSPVHNYTSLVKTYDAFLDVEKENAEFDNEFVERYHDPLLERVRYYAGLALKAYKDRPADRYLSNGVCADAKTRLEKLALLSTLPATLKTHEYDSFDPLLGAYAERVIKPPRELSYSDRIFYEADCAHYARHKEHIEKICLGKVVPKSYKTGRFIAEEECIRQYINSSKGEALRRSVKVAGLDGYMPFLDQTINYDLARLGSVDGSIATIDLSHASDSITPRKLYACFPYAVANDLMSELPRWIKLPDRVRKLRMATPSGSVLTPPIETILFWSIAMAATEWYASYGDPTVQYKLPTAYNDDITCDARVAGAVCDCLVKLGFTVNAEKSFYSPGGAYRESCGGEFVRGRDVTSVYWPRREIYGPSRDDQDIDSLVSLQRSLMSRHEYIPAGRVLRNIIRATFKKVSSFGDSSLSAHTLIDPYPFSTAHYVRPKAWVDVDDAHIVNALSPYAFLQDGKVGFPLVGHPTTAYTRKPRKAEAEFYEYYSYNNFLKHGPHYEEPLLKLLGVSSPREHVQEVISKPVVVWRSSPLIP
jgi:hypothetical protein